MNAVGQDAGPYRPARNLATRFQELFELVPAFDEPSLDQVARIRHDVYCRDLGWEPLREDGRETDEFDGHSLHCLLRQRVSGEPVGCSRLILTRPRDPFYALPFERSCKEVIDRSIVDPAKLPRQTIGEVSRLAVMSAYRQRRGEASGAVSATDGDFDAHGPNTRFPFVPVSLYLGAAAIALRVGVEQVFVVTEPRLADHFVRIGFDIQVIGGAIEHRGSRVPSMLRTSKVVSGLRPMIRPMYDVIQAAVDEAFHAHPEAIVRARTGLKGST